MIRFPSFATGGPSPSAALQGGALSDWMTLRSTYELFERHARTFGDRPALTHIEQGTEDEVALHCTYGQLRSNVARAANVLLRLGARRGVTVGLLVPNLYEQQFLFWASEAVATALPLNFLLDVEHIAGLLAASNTKILVALGPTPGSNIWSKALAVKALMGDKLGWIVQVGGAPEQGAGVVQFEEWLSGASDQLDASLLPGPGDIASMFHTGGTTGVPKLVLHTHRNELAAAYSFACVAELSPEDVGTNGFPMFHVAGANCLSLGTYMAGAHLINLSPAGFRNPDMVKNHWQVIERFGVTCTAAVPTALASIADVPVGDHDISSLRVAYCGGALLPRTVAERFEARSGVEVREVYGMTEACSIICVEPVRGERVLGSAGFAAPFVQVEVRQLLAGDRIGKAVDRGEPGVLVVSGATVTPGYRDAQHNESAFTDDGWLITGDLATMDASGRVMIVGRSKDLIIRSGHNIDPQTIEEAALSHPDVVAAAAVGQPDQYAGELPVCYVVLLPGSRTGTELLAEYIAQRVPERPARPKHVFAVDALPVTGVGKIFKPELRRDAAVRVVTQQADGLPIQRVLASQDRGGKMLMTLVASPGANVDRLRAELSGRLADFQFSWGLVAAKDGDGRE